MRLVLIMGAAIAATTVMAYAQTEERTERTHVFVRHAGGHAQMDSDNDGWISRAESSAGADRIFGELDTNDDGRLTDADRPERFELEMRLDAPPGAPGAPGAGHDNCERTETGEGDERRVTIICRAGEGGEVRRHVLRRGEAAPEAGDDNCERTESGEGDDRRVTVICRDERHAGGDVIIRRHGGEGHDVMIAPMPPHPPHAPVFSMMVLGEDSEADLNNDDAISQDEFRTQHLRMFDAHDANGDGRVRAHRMPEPPEAPVAPTPPSPPRRG